MEIAVTVCLVPDTSSLVGFTDGVLDTSRVTEVLNPYDEYAIEEALRMRDRSGDGRVTLFSVAPASKKPLLQKALAMGADRLVLVDGPESPDQFQTASLLSGAIRATYPDAMPDVVLSGRESTDFRSGAVPGMLAALLGLPSVSAVSSLEMQEGGALLLEREIEGGRERLEARMPLLLTAEKGLNTPRKTSMKGVMEARKKPVEAIPATECPKARARLESLAAAPARAACRMVGGAEELARLLAEEKGVL